MYNFFDFIFILHHIVFYILYFLFIYMYVCVYKVWRCELLFIKNLNAELLLFNVFNLRIDADTYSSC